MSHVNKGHNSLGGTTFYRFGKYKKVYKPSQLLRLNGLEMAYKERKSQVGYTTHKKLKCLKDVSLLIYKNKIILTIVKKEKNRSRARIKNFFEKCE